MPEVGNRKTLAEMDATPEIHRLYPEFDKIYTERNRLVDRLAQLEERARGRPSFEKRLDKLAEQRDTADADLVTIQRKIAREHPEVAYRKVAKNQTSTTIKSYDVTIRQEIVIGGRIVAEQVDRVFTVRAKTRKQARKAIKDAGYKGEIVNVEDRSIKPLKPSISSHNVRITPNRPRIS